jgi:hypothetical protein
LAPPPQAVVATARPKKKKQFLRIVMGVESEVHYRVPYYQFYRIGTLEICRAKLGMAVSIAGIWSHDCLRRCTFGGTVVSIQSRLQSDYVGEAVEVCARAEIDGGGRLVAFCGCFRSQSCLRTFRCRAEPMACSSRKRAALPSRENAIGREKNADGNRRATMGSRDGNADHGIDRRTPW